MIGLPFSAKVRFAVIVERAGLHGYMGSLLVFDAEDFEGAFQRSLELGKGMQKDYTNGNGQRVVWRFVEVVSIDKVRQHSSDWAEVYSEPQPGSDVYLSIDTHFYPERSTPTQTL